MFGIRGFLVVAVLGLGLLGAPALAQDFSAEDRAQLQARIDKVDALVSAGDLAGYFEVVPPRLFRTIAERGGVSEAELIASMREMARQLGEVAVLDYEVDLASTKPALTPDGSRTYLMMPTTTLMEMEGVRFRTRNVTLALKEDGQWHMMRIDEPDQIALLTELWPEFAGVTFPTGTMEIVR